MINTINTFLEPIESLVKKYQKYIWYFFIVLSILSFTLAFSPETVKLTGEQAMNVLWFLLFLPIFARVFGLSLAQTLMPLRKEIGIFMGTLAVVHSIGYIIPDPSMLLYSWFWIENGFLGYLGFWFLAFICTLPLLLTSNDWAIKKLWKNWKKLHRLVYGIVIFTVVHVVLLKFAREFEIGPVLLLVFYFTGKTLEWRGIKLFKKEEKKYKKWQKWLCIPCGYIYDPLIGDENSGIVPGTEFVDIPPNWRCPWCGVAKADFVPYEDGKNEIVGFSGSVIEKKKLNPTTIEFVVEVADTLKSIAGQFMSFIWNDDGWEFIRSYSIAKQEENRFTFLIKLTELGRWARLLEKIESNANIRISGIFGNFLLQNTANPKVFIATGTGLAPIYNMIYSLPIEMKKVLYFSVATESELFYVEELRKIPELELHIHVTRENIEWFESGRVDATLIEGDIETEWYLCGNPKMVSETQGKLKKRGFEKIYSEEF